MQLGKARFIRSIIETAEMLSSVRPEVTRIMPEDAHFEYGIVLSNHIRHTLASLLKNKELASQQMQEATFRQQLSSVVDQIVAQQLLRKNPVIPVSYREMLEQQDDMAEVLRLEKIWWYPGFVSSARYNGCYVPMYNTAHNRVREAFDYQLESMLHETIHQCGARLKMRQKKTNPSPVRLLSERGMQHLHGVG